MSYKSVVLNDHPTSFYLLDEVRSGSVGSYSGIISQFATYQDLKDSGLTYSALSGLPVYDYSGNVNDGYAINASNKELMPLISGGIRGTQILSDTEVHYVPQGIANEYNKDDSFTIEAWCVLPPTEIDITIVGDTSINTGLFYKNGNIVFKVGANEISYSVSNSQSLHLVGIFQGSSLLLYINGVMVKSSNIEAYKFSNSVLDFKTGPSNGKFVIDCVAFYKFSLPESQIKMHYLEGIKEINSSQIVNVDGGYMFSMNSTPIQHQFRFAYPQSRAWSDVVKDGISISEDGSYLYFPETTQSATAEYSFIDSFIVPNYSSISTSQIYWNNDLSGIKVEISLNGINGWRECKNGSPLPYYNKNDNQVSSILYIRVTMSSYDTSKYDLRLKNIEIFFYESKDFYGDNSGYYLSSSFDYSLPKNNSKILSYNKNNGLRMYDGHGFSLNGIPDVKAVEVIFTPELGENVLVSAASKIYEWSSSGAISKTAVASIYVNGINRTSETNVFDFMAVGLPHHVVINFTSAATNIKFNQNQTDSKSGIGHMYNNLAIYEDNLSAAQISQHYLLYTGNILKIIDDTQMTVSEATTGNDFTSFTITSVEPLSISI
jgi:hypothetical protein